MNPVVSIIIVNFQATALIRECIKALKAARIAVSYEVIVVDNSSRTSGLKLLLSEQFADVVYLPMASNLGFAAANNAGVRMARGETVVILNSDITTHPGAIESMVQAVQADPAIGIVAPRLLNPDGSTQQSYFRFYSPFTVLARRTIFGYTPFGKKLFAKALMKDMAPDRAADVDWCLAACYCVRKAVWEELGGMDERFFLYFEDIDLARRMWQRGYRVQYVPKVTMTHLYGQGSAGRVGVRTLLNPLTRLHIESGFRYFFKHGWFSSHKRTNI